MNKMNKGTLNTKMFREVIDYFGSQSKLALAFGVHRSAITQFIRGEHLPAERALQIEILSGGRFLAVNLIGYSYVRSDV